MNVGRASFFNQAKPRWLREAAKRADRAYERVHNLISPTAAELKAITAWEVIASFIVVTDVDVFSALQHDALIGTADRGWYVRDRCEVDTPEEPPDYILGPFRTREEAAKKAKALADALHQGRPGETAVEYEARFAKENAARIVIGPPIVKRPAGYTREAEPIVEVLKKGSYELEDYLAMLALKPGQYVQIPTGRFDDETFLVFRVKDGKEPDVCEDCGRCGGTEISFKQAVQRGRAMIPKRRKA